MQTRVPIADTLASLAGLVHELDWLEPTYFRQHLDRAATAASGAATGAATPTGMAS